MGMFILKFTDEQIKDRYNQFVNDFLKEENTHVEKTEVLPRFWTVNVPDKGFNVTIECRQIGKFHGIEQWCAIVTEKNGERNNFLLFEKEIEQWAYEQRRLRGIETLEGLRFGLKQSDEQEVATNEVEPDEEENILESVLNKKKEEKELVGFRLRQSTINEINKIVEKHNLKKSEFVEDVLRNALGLE
jgi:hypothetical protein